MYRKLNDTGPSIMQEDIAALEGLVGFPLPSDYAAFLLRHNGGSPTPGTVPIEEWPEGGTHDDVRMLYHLGPNAADDVYDLRWNFQALAGRIPPGLLPIADTGGGDEFCLWLTGEERGAVVLWDHEAERHPPTRANLHRVAPTFTKFLELLADQPEDPVPPRAVLRRAANKAAGYDEQPEGYDWHHAGDGKMQLVPRSIHMRTGHNGPLHSH